MASNQKVEENRPSQFYLRGFFRSFCKQKGMLNLLFSFYIQQLSAREVVYRLYAGYTVFKNPSQCIGDTLYISILASNPANRDEKYLTPYKMEPLATTTTVSIVLTIMTRQPPHCCYVKPSPISRLAAQTQTLQSAPATDAE